MSSKITPKCFFSDTPPERIIGTECEYNLQQGKYSNGKTINIDAYISAQAITKAKLNRSDVSHKFLNNGGGLYPEVGQLLEYDSPECLGPREAAAADIAGSLIVADIVEKSGLPHKGLYRISGSDISKVHDSETSGYHENYLIPRCISDSHLIDAVLPAYAASCIWGFSGMVRSSYVFSQKVWDINDSPIERKLERRTGHHKPMFIIPPINADIDTIGPKEWARVERRYADSGLSPEVRYLQFASMSLVLRMIEHKDKIDHKRLARLALVDPVDAAKVFASDLTLKSKASKISGGKIRALEIQKELISIAYSLDEKVKLPDDESMAIGLWEDVVEQFGRCDPANVDYGNLITKLDVAARHKVLANSLVGPGRITNTNKAAVSNSLVWDRVLPTGGAQLWWQKFQSSIVPNELIMAMKEGRHLPRTRAAIRIKELRRDYSSNHRISTIGWSFIHYGNGSSSYHRSLDDLYATS